MKFKIPKENLNPEGLFGELYAFDIIDSNQGVRDLENDLISHPPYQASKIKASIYLESNPE